MYDVGGQRNERRKWIHVFDNVQAVIYVTALSEFDRILWEDDSQNRMVESLELFSNICKEKAFSGTSIILFLNKRDLFEKKIKDVPIQSISHFSDYQGKPCSYDDGVKFFTEKFEAKSNKDAMRRDIFTHVTCATDTNQIKFVFEACQEIILQSNFRDNGFGF